MSDLSLYDASASALGYIYQVRYALLLALQKIGEVDDPDDCFISIEKLDDVAFEQNGMPYELLQSKYHGKSGNLTDRSADIWKTIRIWAEMISNPSQQYEYAIYTLLTTEQAKPGSLAEMLGTGVNRDVGQAMITMREICVEASNQTNQKGYQAFNNLEEWQQEKLLRSTYIICQCPDIAQVGSDIKKQLRITATVDHLDAFYTRLEGEWFKKSINAMSGDQEGRICLSDLRADLDELRSQFLPSNLPADYDDVMPEYMELDHDDKLFVKQMELLGVTDRMIRNAVLDYYKAYQQRSRWSRDGFLKPGEIKKYMARLQDEWEQRAAMQEVEYDLSQETGKTKAGIALYKQCQYESVIPIRPAFNANYVSRGSYHDLADNKEIGWHPDYLELLQEAEQSESA